MKRFIDVHTGEVMAGQGEVVLKSDADSACLIIAAYDATKKIGALAHATLDANGHKHHSPVWPDASHAVEEMINDMQMLGSQADDIEVSIVTGENVRHPENPGYRKNIDEILEILRQHHIRFREGASENIGNAHIVLDVESGQIIRK